MASDGSSSSANSPSTGQGNGRKPGRGGRGTGPCKKSQGRGRRGNKTKKRSDTDSTDDDNNSRQGRGNPPKQAGRGRGDKSNSRSGSSIQKENSDVIPQNSKKSSRGKNNAKSKNNQNKSNKKNDIQLPYPEHWSISKCMEMYNQRQLIRGTIRVLPSRNASAFLSCDRGSLSKDILLETPLDQNRAIHGDTVFVELLPPDENQNEANSVSRDDIENMSRDMVHQMGLCSHDSSDEDEEEMGGDEVNDQWWHEDSVQMNLWAPAVNIKRQVGIPAPSKAAKDNDSVSLGQRKGRVVHVIPPQSLTSEIKSDKNYSASTNSNNNTTPVRNIVGTLKVLHHGLILFNCNNKCLPQFKVSRRAAERLRDKIDPEAIYQAKYTYGTWQVDAKWPPCAEIKPMGHACNVEDETQALLMEHQVDHGEFPTSVLEECQRVVASGEYTNGTESGWKPTPEMYKGRRDFRRKRIFTIDPTTAKDLDDALHIEDLGNGQVEIGVHIADVTHFVTPGSAIDMEARRRCTTVYLVDRTIPMLPRPLCEIACSLNENVERLAFSCVWRMNIDGNMAKNGKQDLVWYGRSVIKSCARLDYATAQNILDEKCGNGERDPDPELWPPSRRPSGVHSMDHVAADVRLMNRVAQARRRLRFQHGAIALHGIKLTFKLDADRETPLLCEPYPIKDSNRLVEEYMLLANYLVAQKMITDAGDRALLRSHEPPTFDGLQGVAQIAKEAIGFVIDITSSETLQKSLNRLGRECNDELVLQCVTELLKTPLQSAIYIAAGEVPNVAWAHFALNIPYYTHFTSPIRRYADVMVHRLLQATLDGPDEVAQFPFDSKEIHQICGLCNEKKDASRKAQERSDVVFLALYLRRHPLPKQLGVVLSVGQKAFTVFVPSLGINALVYLDEHKEWIQAEAYTVRQLERRLKLIRTAGHNGETWSDMVIKAFTKVRVTAICKDKPPIDVKLQLEGPWTDN